MLPRMGSFVTRTEQNRTGVLKHTSCCIQLLEATGRSAPWSSWTHSLLNVPYRLTPCFYAADFQASLWSFDDTSHLFLFLLSFALFIYINKIGKYAGGSAQGGTMFADPAFAKGVASGKLTSSMINRFSIVLMGGIAAEAINFGSSEVTLCECVRSDLLRLWLISDCSLWFI